MFAGSKVGLGVKVAGITQDFTGWHDHQHRARSGRCYQPERFFRLVDSNGSVFYSRNGQFKLDETVTREYARFTADGLPGNRYAADYSARANPDQYFDPEYPDGSENYHHGIDADQPEFQWIRFPTVTPFSASNADSYNKKVRGLFSTVRVMPHDMSVYFVKTGDNNWQVYTRIAVIQQVQPSLQ